MFLAWTPSSGRKTSGQIVRIPITTIHFHSVGAYEWLSFTCYFSCFFYDLPLTQRTPPSVRHFFYNDLLHQPGDKRPCLKGPRPPSGEFTPTDLERYESLRKGTLCINALRMASTYFPLLRSPSHEWRKLIPLAQVTSSNTSL